jgi:hypothetical protein
MGGRSAGDKQQILYVIKTSDTEAIAIKFVAVGTCPCSSSRTIRRSPPSKRSPCATPASRCRFFWKSPNTGVAGVRTRGDGRAGVRRFPCLAASRESHPADHSLRAGRGAASRRHAATRSHSARGTAGALRARPKFSAPGLEPGRSPALHRATDATLQALDDLRLRRPRNACVTIAALLGGHARVGFENNFHLPDGTVAPSNAALVSAAAAALSACGLRPATADALTSRAYAGRRCPLRRRMPARDFTTSPAPCSAGRRCRRSAYERSKFDSKQPSVLNHCVVPSLALTLRLSFQPNAPIANIDVRLVATTKQSRDGSSLIPTASRGACT